MTSLRKNLIVVPSDITEPNQVNERVSLFNEDGSSFSAGGGRTLVYRAHADGGVNPVEYSGSGNVRVGPDISLLETHRDPELDFKLFGDTHSTWTPTPGVLVFDMRPGKNYSVHLRGHGPIAFHVGIGATTFSTLTLSADAYVVPYSVDGWSGSENGLYEQDVTGREMINPIAPITSTEWVAFEAKRYGSYNYTRRVDLNYTNDQTMPRALVVGWYATIEEALFVAGTTLRVDAFDLSIFEEALIY